MAVAHRYGRPVKWVRDDRGIAHAVPGPVTGAPVPPSITLVPPSTTPPSPVPQPERPEAPFAEADSWGCRPTTWPGVPTGFWGRAGSEVDGLTVRLAEWPRCPRPPVTRP
jgi:hypothetical protein